jgi:hypothetical protein
MIRVSDPANVPHPTDVRWEIVRNEPATMAQVKRLDELERWEGVSLADLYGDGFTDAKDLGKWAAHWGIDVLESRRAAREVEAAHRAVEERRDQIMKSWIANYYRAQHPGKYPYTTEVEF